MAKSGSDRVKAYRENTSTERLEIIGLQKGVKQSFKNISGMEKVTNADKLKTLIDYWVDGHKKPSQLEIFKPKIENKKSKPSLKTTDWVKFEEDFNNFLFDFKMSNQTRPKLRTQGKLIREELLNNREYRLSFRNICNKLPGRVLKQFKPMYLQGYFYLYQGEIIEISQQDSGDKILLLLLESLIHMGKDEPVKEAKKVLGLI